MGMQVWRYIDRLNERDMWAFWRRNASGGRPSQPPERHHDSGPTAAGQLLRPPFRAASTARCAWRSISFGFDARVNVGRTCISLTSNLTPDATINPDFGQVEWTPVPVLGV
jgi:hypothetical protein